MYTREFVYEDFAGTTRKETARFQLTKAEIMELAYSVKGGFIAAAQRMIDNRDEPAMFKNFKKIIAMAYGEISEDNRRFVKSPELSKAFMETPMYDILFNDMITQPGYLDTFLSEVVPKDQKEAVAGALKDFAENGITSGTIEAAVTGE